MLLVVVATLGGLLGGGPATLWTWRVASGPLEVEYAPVVRFGTPAGLVLHAAAAPGADSVAVTLPARIVKRYGMQGVVPAPLSSAAGRDELRMVFPVQAGAREVTIQVGGMPAASGLMRLWARLDDGPAARWTQVVLP